MDITLSVKIGVLVAAGAILMLAAIIAIAVLEPKPYDRRTSSIEDQHELVVMSSISVLLETDSAA